MADLATLLESEADAEIEAVLADARSQADRIVRQATEQAQASLEARRRALEGELAAGLVRARSAADLESAALRLAAAHDATERAFAEAETELRAYTRTAEYRGTLQALIREARYALGDIATLEVNPADVTAAAEAARAAEVSAPVLPNPEVQTGVRAIGPGGRTSITNTLLGRLARARDQLSSDVARLLAPASGGPAGPTP